MSCNFSTGPGAPTAAPVTPASYFDSASGFTYNWNLGSQSWVPVPKVYLALLSQNGTAAPSAIVLENTLGVTVAWSRTSAGNYVATPSAPAFTTNKTAVTLANNTGQYAHLGWAFSGNNLNIETKIEQIGASDGVLALNTLEIRVYP